MSKSAAKHFSEDKLYLLIVFLSLISILGNITLFAHNRLTANVLSAEVEAAESDPQQALLEEKTFWEDIIQKHPSYRDAYLELADIENRLGNNFRGSELLNLARGIDPNFIR